MNNYQFFPYARINPVQEKIIPAIINTQSGESIIINAPTGSGKSIASLCALLILKEDNQKIIIIVKTIAQMNSFIKECSRINQILSDNDKLLIIPLLGRARLCIPNCSTVHSNNKINYLKNDPKSILQQINQNLLEEPSIKVFQRSLNYLARKSCRTVLTHSMLRFSDIIITTYPYLEKDLLNQLLKRLGMKINQLLILVDEAHNLFAYKYWILKRSEFEELRQKLGSLPIFNIVDNIFKELPGKKISADYLPKEERKLGLDIIKNYTNTDLQRMNLSSDISPLIDKFTLFIENFDRGKIYVYATQMIVADIFPDRLLSNIKDVRTQIYQSATFFDLNLTRRLFGLNGTTQLLNLNPNAFNKRNNYSTTINQNANQLRCWLPVVSTLKKKRNEHLFQKLNKLIYSIHEASPRHTLVLCPSYDFIDKLIQNLDTSNLVIESRDISTKHINKQILSLKSPSIIVANQRGKIREGNEWVLNGTSLVSTVIFAGLPTYVPSGDKFVERIIRNQMRNKLGSNSLSNSFQFDMPLITNVIQSFGRSIRNSRDKGSLIIIDRRALDRLQKPLALRMYKTEEILKSNLRSFFAGYPSLEAVLNNLE